MAFLRASAVRGAFRAAQSSRPTLAKSQTWRQIGRRGYASHGHESAKASSDLPWYVLGFLQAIDVFGHLG